MIVPRGGVSEVSIKWLDDLKLPATSKGSCFHEKTLKNACSNLWSLREKKLKAKTTHGQPINSCGYEVCTEDIDVHDRGNFSGNVFGWINC